MDKNNNNKEKKPINVKQTNEKKIGYLNNICKPYKGSDGYLHCAYCRRRYEPGHLCDRECK